MGVVMYRVFFASSTTTTEPVAQNPTTQPSTNGNFPVSGQGNPSTQFPDGSSTNQPNTQPSQNQNGAFPQSDSIVQTVTTDVALSATVNTNGQITYYNQIDGKFYRLDANGQPLPLSDQVFFEVDNVTWSPTQNEAILEYPDGANIYFDFSKNQQRTLPKHWESFSFSTDGDHIAAKSIGFSEENQWLVVSNPDGSETTFVQDLGNNADKVDVSWSPNNQVLALARTGEALGAFREEVLLVGQNNENFKSLIVEGRGFESQWSPTGSNLLHSVFSNTSDYKPELWIASASGQNVGANRRRLNVQTWAHKCAFQNETFIYCGVPLRLESGAGYAPELAQYTPDRLVRINAQTGQQTQLSLDTTPTITSIFFSEDGQTLYYTDNTSDGIFSVSL